MNIKQLISGLAERGNRIRQLLHISLERLILASRGPLLVATSTKRLVFCPRITQLINCKKLSQLYDNNYDIIVVINYRTK